MPGVGEECATLHGDGEECAMLRGGGKESAQLLGGGASAGNNEFKLCIFLSATFFFDLHTREIWPVLLQKLHLRLMAKQSWTRCFSLAPHRMYE